jgi:hypothetical protein
MTTTSTNVKLTCRVVIAAVLSGQVGLLLGCSGIPYPQLLAHESVNELAAAEVSGACPAKSFSAFVDVFAESAAIQRRYIQIPIKYGLLDATLIGTIKEDSAFSVRTIKSFEALPFFDRQDGGRILPSKQERMKKGLEIRIVDSGKKEDGIFASVFLPDSGSHVEYRFARTNNCWKLVEIDDDST